MQQILRIKLLKLLKKERYEVIQVKTALEVIAEAISALQMQVCTSDNKMKTIQSFSFQGSTSKL